MRKLQDFGAKIGGARKDCFVKGWSEADYEKMTSAERERVARRERLWPAPDYPALVASGIPEAVVFRLKLLRERLPTRIVPRGARWAWRIEFDLETRRRGYVMAVLRLRDAVAGVRTWDDLAGVADVYRSLSVESRWALDMVTVGDAARPFLDYVHRELFVDYVNGVSEDEMLLAAKERGWPGKAAASLRQKPVVIQRPKVENPQRVGGSDLRNGRTLEPAEVMQIFGLRGVEFGNWVGAREQRRILDQAVDALADLADVIGMPTDGISLGGTLSLAFGARGTGGNKFAHYEPTKRVINLTRTRGVGALAHEWWHAFDDHLARLAGEPELPASAHDEPTNNSIVAIREALANALYDFPDELYFPETSRFLQEALKLDAGRSKPYYALPHELAARAFEAGVEAVLRESGRRNDFLVTGTENKTLYPTPSDASNFFYSLRSIIRQVVANGG